MYQEERKKNRKGYSIFVDPTETPEAVSVALKYGCESRDYWLLGATVAVHAHTAPPTATGAAKDKAEALREYAKLKEDGMVSEEEVQRNAELVGRKK